MKFRCIRDCLIQVFDHDREEEVVNLRARRDMVYEHKFVDFTKHSRHFVRLPDDADMTVAPQKDEFPAAPPMVTPENVEKFADNRRPYAAMERHELVGLAQEAGIDGAEKLNKQSLVSKLRNQES